MRSEARFPLMLPHCGGALLLAVVMILMPACARKKKVRAPVPAVPGSVEFGIASWYGHPYHGRRSANGEVYDMEKLTAAHRTLPFGTWVEVDNLTNQKTVRVRVTDRGPFVRGRIIDLSRAAARQIAMIGPGTAKVRVLVIEPPKEAVASDFYAVQVGAFQDRANADRLLNVMRDRYGECRLVVRDGNPRFFRVLVGREPTIEGANALAERMRVERGDAFVVRLDEPISDP
jgi:rare lipoprotein A